MSRPFQKNFSLGKLLRLNVSKRGLGADGRLRRTISIPGTGLRATESINDLVHAASAG